MARAGSRSKTTTAAERAMVETTKKHPIRVATIVELTQQQSAQDRPAADGGCIEQVVYRQNAERGVQVGIVSKKRSNWASSKPAQPRPEYDLHGHEAGERVGEIPHHRKRGDEEPTNPHTRCGPMPSMIRPRADAQATFATYGTQIRIRYWT